jgi:hypothetical protein
MLSYFADCLRAYVNVATCATAYLTLLLLGLHAARADSIDQCMQDFSDPYNVVASSSPPQEYRDGCLDALEATGRADATYVAGRIRIAKGQYEIGRQLLRASELGGIARARDALLALRMAEFDDRHPGGWRSAHTPNGVDASYTLEYTAILRAARLIYADSPILYDFVLSFAPVESERLEGLKSLLKLSGGNEPAAEIAQNRVGRRIHGGGIEKKLLSNPETMQSLNKLLNSTSNPEIIWWIGCAGSHSQIYETTGVQVLNEDITTTNPRMLVQAALAAAEKMALSDKTNWKFRGALFQLENERLATSSLVDEISLLKSLAALGYRDARQYLMDAAVGEVIGAYSSQGFGQATDLCRREVRTVFDNAAAIDWWSARLAARECEAIGSLINAREYLATKGIKRTVPRMEGDPVQMLSGCRSEIESHYLEIN